MCNRGLGYEMKIAIEVDENEKWANKFCERVGGERQ